MDNNSENFSPISSFAFEFQDFLGKIFDTGFIFLSDISNEISDFSQKSQNIGLFNLSELILDFGKTINSYRTGLCELDLVLEKYCTIFRYTGLLIKSISAYTLVKKYSQNEND